MAARLKYFSIKYFAFSPTKYIIIATTKNLPPRPTIDARTSVAKFKSKTPAAIVKILYGIGVNAAPKTAKKPYSW